MQAIHGHKDGSLLNAEQQTIATHRVSAREINIGFAKDAVIMALRKR